MRYITNRIKVEIDNASLRFGGGKIWFEGLLKANNETKIRTMISQGTTNTIDLPNMGFLTMKTRPRSASFSIGRSVSSRPRRGSLPPRKSAPITASPYTNPNPTQIEHWAKQKLTVTGTNRVANKAKLLDFTNGNVLHHWAKIKLNAVPEEPGFKIKVDWGVHEGLVCHYESSTKELEVKVKNNYISNDICSVLGGILFEAHNARNGAHFRTATTNWKDKKGANHINIIERASKYVAIESDTYLKSTEDCVNIAKKKDGYIGPQEWRNIMAIGEKLGFTSYPWAMNANAMLKFATSIHNPSLTGLQGSTFSTYIDRQGSKELNPGWISGELIVWHRRNKTQLHLATGYGSFKTKIGYPTQHLNGSNALKFFKTLYVLLIKTGQNAHLVTWLNRWRVPEDIYDMAVGTVLQSNLSEMTGGVTPQNLKSTVTITSQKFYDTYHI